MTKISVSLLDPPTPLCLLYRAPGWHPEGEAPGGWWHRFGGGGGQRPSGGPWAVGETQKCHTQDFLQVWQDHHRVLSRGWRLDQRVCVLLYSVMAVYCFNVELDVNKQSHISCRYIFLEYAAPTQALEAVKNADGYKLDKQHTFRVNLFTDFDK